MQLTNAFQQIINWNIKYVGFTTK